MFCEISAGCTGILAFISRVQIGCVWKKLIFNNKRCAEIGMVDCCLRIYKCVFKTVHSVLSGLMYSLLNQPNAEYQIHTNSRDNTPKCFDKDIPSSVNLIFLVPCIMLYNCEISPTRCNKWVRLSPETCKVNAKNKTQLLHLVGPISQITVPNISQLDNNAKCISTAILNTMRIVGRLHQHQQ